MMHRTTLGLDERIERVLTYSLFWVSGIVFFFVEKNPNVRWNAIQSVVTFGTLSLFIFAVNLLSGIFHMIPLLNVVTDFGLGLLLRILWFSWFILWFWLMYNAYKRPNYRLPFVSDIIRAIF